MRTAYGTLGHNDATLQVNEASECQANFVKERNRMMKESPHSLGFSESDAKRNKSFRCKEYRLLLIIPQAHMHSFRLKISFVALAEGVSDRHKALRDVREIDMQFLGTSHWV